MVKKEISTKDWIPIERILDNGIIYTKNREYIKILKINPINFNLKTELEKNSILKSYKEFLKICNFDIQILIQSNKEDLSNHISKVKEKTKNEKENIKKISEKYIDFIKKTNKEKKSSSKNFYILIKEIPENKKQKTDDNIQKIIFDKLNDKYFNIKECLSRCGNVVIDISDKKNTEKILYSFFNSRKDLLEN